MLDRRMAINNIYSYLSFYIKDLFLESHLFYMKKPFVNIGILLLLIIILPPLLFTSYEIGNLYQNEKMIDSIYTRQLESVIFSINQYSDDILSRWANQLEYEIQKQDTIVDDIVNGFIKNNSSIQLILFADGIHNSYFIDKGQKHANIDYFNSLLSKNEQIIKRLVQYIDGGYRKIQPIDIEIPEQSLFLFALEPADKKVITCGIVVNTLDFIKENLGPKIQSTASDQFYFSVFEISTGKEVYSNELYETTEKNIEHKKPLWLMPDYQLGIQIKGDTIENLVQERTNFNIWIIIIMDIVLILAAILIYRSLRQQMKLAQLKSEFVSNVSHEIRTPLAIINMYSETLEMDRIRDDTKKKEYYRIINTEANRLSVIVNKILSFSKIDSGKREYKFVEADINVVIKQIVDQYAHHFDRVGTNCNLLLMDNLPKVMIDNEAITDALINLIDNAIKYSTDNKQIDISTGQNRNGIFIEVKDYGIGIEGRYHKLVFDKFFRVTAGNLAHKAKGSGIGLSIVQHIMSAHNGSITLISKPNIGSRFILNFPLNIV